MPHNQTLLLYGPALIIIIALCWGLGRIFYLSKAEGVTVLSFLRRKKTWYEQALGLIAVVLDGYLLLRPLFPQLDQLVGTQTSPAPVFGLILMGLGILLMIISQIDMGRAWRIGVPEELEASQSLITGGVYAYSRNPIYVAIMMFLIGAAIIAPGPLTIGAAVATFGLMHPIIWREEAFMQQAFGAPYIEYCQKVRRWF